MNRIVEAWRRLPRTVRRGGAMVVGVILLATGAALLVLPGPGLLLIALGLGVLATEFVWPRKLLQQVTSRIQKVRR